MKTLHLNLKRKWFDMILSGEKKEEYREIKEYWCRRLLNPPFSFMSKTLGDVLQDLDACPNSTFRDFDTITFSNGMTKNRDQFVIELKGIDINDGRPEWGAVLDKKYFVLYLGEIVNR